MKQKVGFAVAVDTVHSSFRCVEGKPKFDTLFQAN